MLGLVQRELRHNDPPRRRELSLSVPTVSAKATLGFSPICLQPLARLGVVTLASPVNSQLPQFHEISSRMLTQLAHQLVSFTGVEVERTADK